LDDQALFIKALPLGFSLKKPFPPIKDMIDRHGSSWILSCVGDQISKIKDFTARWDILEQIEELSPNTSWNLEQLNVAISSLELKSVNDGNDC
jgi:hypothetical protein